MFYSHQAQEMFKLHNNEAVFPCSSYIIMQDFAYKMNVISSPESYIYVIKKIVVMSINIHVSECFANVSSASFTG